MNDELQTKIDTLTAELAKLKDEKSQADANINALTTKYKEMEKELASKKEEVVTLKAANMALALTGKNEVKTSEDILADLFIVERK